MIDKSVYQKLAQELYTDELISKASRIELLAFDADGVLTDGGLYFDHDGEESKRFHAQDGHGIKILQSIDVEMMIISGRNSKCVTQRGDELGIKRIVQGTRDKLKSFHKQNINLLKDKVCYVGDDTVDVELLQYVGLSVIVPNSNPILNQLDFDWVTPRQGGYGAIRDVCDLIYFSKIIDAKKK
jgi:3-deoxy-D-manno-octulosonate 8-phosphate phosphatase (KDO 8-P phosphatase)